MSAIVNESYTNYAYLQGVKKLLTETYH
jgi:hypothetical protein